MAKDVNNERGAGRMAKYSETTLSVAFRIPESKVKAAKAHMEEFLSPLRIGVEFKANFDNAIEASGKLGKGVFKSKKEFIIHSAPVINPILKDPSKIFPISLCDCKLDDKGLLRRGKVPCNKSKSEHNF